MRGGGAFSGEDAARSMDAERDVAVFWLLCASLGATTAIQLTTTSA